MSGAARVARARTPAALSLSDYRALASFRYEIRKFLAFSEQAARRAGIEPQQHQLLLALEGLPSGTRPTIGAMAERLCVQHHTTVALVDRLEAAGLVRRERSREDRREILIRMREAGRTLLRELTELHRDQIRTVGPQMVSALGAILDEAPDRQ